MLCSVLLIAVICQSLCEVGDLFANIWAVSARYPCLTALVTHTGDGGSRTVRSQHHNHWSMIVLNSIIPFHFGFWSLPDLGICFDTVGWWQEGHSACKKTECLLVVVTWLALCTSSGCHHRCLPHLLLEQNGEWFAVPIPATQVVLETGWWMLLCTVFNNYW